MMMSEEPPLLCHLRDAEECLRDEFGTEVFQRGNCKVDARIVSARQGFDSIGDDLLSTPRRGWQLEIIVFKDEWGDTPSHAQKTIWNRSDGKVRLQVDTWDGGETVSPTYTINLISI